MAKIAIIGAGGFVFPLRLIGDILSFRELQDAELALMDINPETLARTARATRELVSHHKLAARVFETTSRHKALAGADYVIVTFQVGGLDAYRFDVEIPRRYGIDQPDRRHTRAGGGIPLFAECTRLLRPCPRHAPTLPRRAALKLRQPDGDELRLLGALRRQDRRALPQRPGHHSDAGRHSWRTLHRGFLPRRGNQPSGLDFRVPARRSGTLPGAARGDGPRPPHGGTLAGGLEADRGNHSETRGWSTYEGAQERVRTEIMAAFGFFHTESSHHASEYLPYFRKDRQLIGEMIPQRWDYFEVCSQHDEAGLEDLLAQLKGELRPSLEYGAGIVHSIETGTPRVVYGNVANHGLITNLPAGCCVEVPCLVDGGGVQPTAVGALPPQCAALNRSNVAVQELAVEAVLTENVEHIYHAVQLDPLTGALLTLTQIRELVGEMLEAEALWLPDFAKSSRHVPA